MRAALTQIFGCQFEIFGTAKERQIVPQLAFLCHRHQAANDHRVKEESDEMFPKAREAKKLDLVALRADLEARKAELMDQQMTAA